MWQALKFAAALAIAGCSTLPENSPSKVPLKKEDAGSLIEDRIEGIHSSNVILDAHADIVLPSTSHSYLAPGGESKVSPAKLKTGGVNTVVMALAVGPGPRTPAADEKARSLIDEKLLAIRALLETHGDDVSLLKSSADIIRSSQLGKTGIILGFQNARALQSKVSALRELYDAGVRVFALNHLGHNDFSDSSRPKFDSDSVSYEVSEEHGGLSALGRQAIELINDLGGVVDVSQMTTAATLQTVELSRSPVIASHSNVRAITNVSRNLSDQEIDRIGERGGVIHIAAFGAYLVGLSDAETLNEILLVREKHKLPKEYSYPYELYWELKDAAAQRAFLTGMRRVIGPGSINDMVNHINYIVNRIGIDHVGIGNDFNHGSGITGFADASEAKNLTRALLENGYSDEDIIKIWGGNFMRVFKLAEQLAETTD